VNSLLFSAIERKESFCALIPKLDAAAQESGAGTFAHRIFSFLARRTLTGSSISLSGNLHPHQSTCDPLFFTYQRIGTRDFMSPVVENRTLGSPKPDNQSTLTFSFRIGTSSIAISPLAISNNLYPQLPIPDTPKLRHTRASLTLHVTSPYRDFGVHNIVNPDVNVSGLLTTKLR
jgi:hypothetical protein